MKTYAGIGSRKTPSDILVLMERIAARLEQFGYVLNSGGADGADSAFAKGTQTKNVIIPWKGFNGIDGIVPVMGENTKIAESLHPAWHRCSQGVKKLHSRNVNQILGVNMDEPVKFVICWTPNAAKTGGTATAIELAEQNDIPVFNLADKKQRNRLIRFVNSMHED